MTPLIQIDQVSQTFNRHQPDEVQALRDVSLDLQTGETTVLTGPSGSGKTSLLSLIGCMARPTSGRVHLEQREVTRLPERFLAEVRRENFGFVFQQFNLLRDLTVTDNILLPLTPTSLPAREMRNRAEEVLERFDLTRRATLKVRQLSGGEQQRVAIARALINRPRVLIADEPTAHLDHALAEGLMELLSSLKTDGTTLILASHDPFVIDHPLIDRRVQLHDGALA